MTNKPMILRELTITQNQSYETNPGKYKGEVKFESGQGKLHITLDETVSQNLLAYLGPVLVKASAGLANQITNCLELSYEESKNKAIEAGVSIEPNPTTP
jgi:hypothetical protein